MKVTVVPRSGRETVKGGLELNDSVISWILATGAGAAFGATVDLKAQVDGSALDKFFETGSAGASFLFLGFLCTGVLSILSSLAVPKKLEG